MPDVSNWSPSARFILLGASIIIIVAGMRAASSILNPIFMALLIAIVCLPIQTRLIARGRSKVSATTSTLIIITIVGFLLLGFIAISARQVIDQLPIYQLQFQALSENVIQELDNRGLADDAVETFDAFDWGGVFSFLTSVLRGLIGSLGDVVLILLILIYIIVDAPNIPKRLHAVLGDDHVWFTRGGTFVESVQRYMIVKTAIGVVVAAIQTVIMLLFGVDFAIQWGVLAVFANYIPNVGFVIGLIPPALLAILELGLIPAVIFITLYFLANFVIESFVAPRFMGDELNISPLFIFLSLIFWAYVLGAYGAILAVPLTLFVKHILLDGNESAKPLVALIRDGTGEVKSNPVTEDKDNDETEDENEGDDE